MSYYNLLYYLSVHNQICLTWSQVFKWMNYSSSYTHTHIQANVKIPDGGNNKLELRRHMIFPQKNILYFSKFLGNWRAILLIFKRSKAMRNLDSILKSRDITLLIKVCMVKAMVFSSSHVWMWEFDHKEGWVPKNSCFQTVVLEKTLESPLGSKEIKPVNPKGNQPWIFIERTDVEVETPILWPPDGKRRLIGKDSDAGKDWRQEEKEMAGDEMVGWHHQLNGHEFVQTPGDSEEQGSLVCCMWPMGSQKVRHDWAAEQQEIKF